jgi:hypothetical protein
MMGWLYLLGEKRGRAAFFTPNLPESNQSSVKKVEFRLD